MHYCPSGSKFSCQIFRHCSWNNLPSAILVLLHFIIIIIIIIIYFSTSEIIKDWTFNANISTGQGRKINKQLMTTFLLSCCKNSKHIRQINEHCYSKCSKCRPSAFTQARRRFLKFAIVYCGNSSQIFTSADFSSRMSFGCGFIYKTEWRNCDVVVKLSWYSVSWYSIVFVFANKIWTDKNTQRHVHLEIMSSETKLVPFLHAIMKLYNTYAVCVKLRPH